MSLAFPAWRTYVEVSDCSVLTMPIPALHFTFKNNKKPKQSNKQISKSSLSSVVAAGRVCVCVCRFARRLLWRAKARTCLQGKSSSEGFFSSSSPISRCWGNRHPRCSERLTHPARSSATRIAPWATAREQRKYRLQQFNMKYIKPPFSASPGHDWWQLTVSGLQRL